MTAFALKIIASVCMLIDHIGAVFVTPDWLRGVGRIAFPIYAYLVAQGCKKTRNINRYLFRLGLFALISELPFDWAFHYTLGKPINPNDLIYDSNIFFTLFLACASIVVFQRLQNKKRPWMALFPFAFFFGAIVLVERCLPAYVQPIEGLLLLTYTGAALCFAQFLPNNTGLKEEGSLAGLKKKIIPLVAILPILWCAKVLHTDYALLGVLLIFILYLANPENRLSRTIILALWVLYQYGQMLFYKMPEFNQGGEITSWTWQYDPTYLYFVLFALVAAVLLFFYNGKKGPGGKTVKWAFYVFYPAHIAVLAILRFMIYGY